MQPPQPMLSLRMRLGAPSIQLVPRAWGETCSCSSLWPDALQLVYQWKVTGFEGEKGNLLPQQFKPIRSPNKDEATTIGYPTQSLLYLGRWKYKASWHEIVMDTGTPSICCSESCIFGRIVHKTENAWHLEQGSAESPQGVAAATFKT